jgi:transcriptional regulator with XRE-family HTH domain
VAGAVAQKNPCPEEEPGQELYRTIGKNITVFRRLKGLSIRELACSTTISERRLVSYEDGTRRIPASHLSAIAQVCTVDIRLMFSASGPFDNN